MLRSLYILLGVVDEVEVWRSHIEDIAFTNNTILADQQETYSINYRRGGVRGGWWGVGAFIYLIIVHKV